MALKNDLSLMIVTHNTTNYIFSSSFIQRMGPDWDKRQGHPFVKYLGWWKNVQKEKLLFF
jgi:hypothetical protein